jgi:hypothetical protein
VAVPELEQRIAINDWVISGTTANYRKEVLGIESAIPKIC